MRRMLKIIREPITEIGKFFMLTVKERVSEIIQAQPDDSSFDEILRELAFSRMVEKGLEDSRLDRKISNEEMEHRIRSWQK